MNIELSLMEKIKLVNSPEVLPKMAFRRDVVVYELVCYVNNIICCLISLNYELIHVLIERVRYFIESNDISDYREYIYAVDNLIREVEVCVK